MARSASEIRSIRMAQILYLALFHEGQRSRQLKATDVWQTAASLRRSHTQSRTGDSVCRPFRGGMPRQRRTRQRPRYGLNFGRNLRNGTIGGVARAATHSRCNSPSPRSFLRPANFASFCKNSLRQIPVTPRRWRGSCRCAWLASRLVHRRIIGRVSFKRLALRVRLMPPAYVERHKNDSVGRPTIVAPGRSGTRMIC
jgi:hypothetical protein